MAAVAYAWTTPEVSGTGGFALPPTAATVWVKQLAICDVSNSVPGLDSSLISIPVLQLSTCIEATFSYSLVGQEQRPSAHAWNASRSCCCRPPTSTSSILAAVGVFSIR